jgi:hypothetical protein
MVYKTIKRLLRGALGAFLAASLVGASGAAASASGANLSGNVYFPLIVGAKWAYREVAGPTAGTSYTEQVVSGHASAAGEVVGVRYAYSGGTLVNAQYTIEPNGTIEVQGATSGGRVSFSSSGSTYFLPTAAQVVSCRGCHFTGTVTTSFAGSPVRVTEHITETVTSMGQQTVHVVAGTYTAEKLHLLLNISGHYSVVTISDTVSSYVYLVRNVGVVESGGGTVTATVLGHASHASTGTVELVHYAP